MTHRTLALLAPRSLVALAAGSAAALGSRPALAAGSTGAGSTAMYLTGLALLATMALAARLIWAERRARRSSQAAAARFEELRGLRDRHDLARRALDRLARSLAERERTQTVVEALRGLEAHLAAARHAFTEGDALTDQGGTRFDQLRSDAALALGAFGQKLARFEHELLPQTRLLLRVGDELAQARAAFDQTLGQLRRLLPEPQRASARLPEAATRLLDLAADAFAQGDPGLASHRIHEALLALEAFALPVRRAASAIDTARRRVAQAESAMQTLDRLGDEPQGEPLDALRARIDEAALRAADPALAFTLAADALDRATVLQLRWDARKALLTAPTPDGQRARDELARRKRDRCARQEAEIQQWYDTARLEETQLQLDQAVRAYEHMAPRAQAEEAAQLQQLRARLAEARGLLLARAPKASEAVDLLQRQAALLATCWRGRRAPQRAASQHEPPAFVVDDFGLGRWSGQALR